MGQGASAANHNSDLRNGSTKQRQAKHRRSTRSLPDTTLIRTTPANYQNGSRPAVGNADATNIPTSISTSAMAYQHNVRRAGVSTNGSVSGGQGVGVNSMVSFGQDSSNQHEQDMVMKKYMHRDAAPYYVSTQAKASCGPRSLDISLNRQWGENGNLNGHGCRKSARSKYDETSPGSSNWSDVASDMFRLAKHQQTNYDRSVNDVQSDFVPPVGHDHRISRHSKASSKRCQQQKKSKRSDKQNQHLHDISTDERRIQRHENGEPDGSPFNSRLHFRDCNGLTMTPVPEYPYKEHQESMKQKVDGADQWRDKSVTKRSKSVHDCASTKLQPPTHPPPRPPKGKLHYYARLENDPSNQSITSKEGANRKVEQWIDFPSTPTCVNGLSNQSGSTDTPTPRSPGSSECDKLVIQSLKAELSAERSLRVDAERRCKSYEKEIEANRHRVHQLEDDVQKLHDAMDDMKRVCDEEAASSKKKMDDLKERCRLLSEDLRRSTDEKRQVELRCDQEKSSYEDYMDSVANQVGQALARQQSLKAECARLQKRTLEVEWENKVLKAQLRLTPMWTNDGAGLGTINGNYCTPTSSTAHFIPASSVAPKADSGTFVRPNVLEQQNNGQNGVTYRRKSFRDKMAGLHKYRQSMGSDPTLDQSGVPTSFDAALLTVDNLALFNEDNNNFGSMGATDAATLSNLRLASGISRRPQEHPESSFFMLNAGEGLCSRPTSFGFDTAAALSVRSGVCPTNGGPAHLLQHRSQNVKIDQSLLPGNYSYNELGSNIAEEDDDDDEPVKNYTAMFNEEAIASFSSGASAGIATPHIAIGTPMFNGIGSTTVGHDMDREAIQNNSQDSSTETLNAGINVQGNGFSNSPKRKLDVVVNMLTNIEMRQPFPLSLWPFRKESGDGKTKIHFLHPGVGLIRDDGYSTMSSELYTAFDSSLLNRLKSSSSFMLASAAEETAKDGDLAFPAYFEKIARSSSDGQLNEMNKLEQRIRRKNEASLNVDTFERDCIAFFGLPDEEICVGGSRSEQGLNREGLCDLALDIQVPGLNPQNHLATLTSLMDSTQTRTPSADQFPPDPTSSTPSDVRKSDLKNAANDNPKSKPDLPPKSVLRRNAAHRLAATSSNRDSSSTDDSDCLNGTIIDGVQSHRRTTKFSNVSASSTSTSFTSDDEDNGRMYVDESAKTTMRIWLKQLKIKRGGQKSGLVRYVPPENRPSILRTGIFARFGAEERRALASFDFLHQTEECNVPKTSKKAKSRSITDLYENLPYHERTGMISVTNDVHFDRSRCESRLSLSTLTSIGVGDRGLGQARSYQSSLFLSDFCNDEGNCSSSTSNSSLSFTFDA